ncbi:hypothetical protein [Rhizobium binae]|uniref:hypothetical protein n=1 Tax=Rhizobium binae TaxID=1138190 RepID=UPI001C83999D|nr:hypothetical protein [Rhizobium binae]MBX4963331.1 hypothetical protein [Rhizobium binae]
MLKQYIVLPAHGFRSPVLAQAAALRLTIPFAAAAGGTAALTREAMSKVEVVDSVSVDGPKLVEMTPETELELRLEEPALKIVPLITYEKMRAIYKVKRAAAAAVVAQPGQGAVLRVEDTDGNSLSGPGL